MDKNVFEKWEVEVMGFIILCMFVFSMFLDGLLGVYVNFYGWVYEVFIFYWVIGIKLRGKFIVENSWFFG